MTFMEQCLTYQTLYAIFSCNILKFLILRLISFELLGGEKQVRMHTHTHTPDIAGSSPPYPYNPLFPSVHHYDISLYTPSLAQCYSCLSSYGLWK